MTNNSHNRVEHMSLCNYNSIVLANWLALSIMVKCLMEMTYLLLDQEPPKHDLLLQLEGLGVAVVLYY